MNIRLVQDSDAAEWLRMRVALWPDEPEKEAAEIALFLSTTPHTKLAEMHEAFVCERPDGTLCGLVEVSIHTSASGCETGIGDGGGEGTALVAGPCALSRPWWSWRRFRRRRSARW